MDLVELDLKHIWHPCSQMHDYESFKPIVIKRAKGVYLYDKNDKAYIDIISSWWCNLFGHLNETINESIKEQLTKIEHVIFANFTHEGAINLAQNLASILPNGLTKFNFSDNGSSAVESALKMAFQYQAQTDNSQKTKFMCLEEGYHGETLGALSVGAMDLYAKIYKPILIKTIRIKAPNCYRCEFGKNRDNCACECFIYAESEFEKHAKHTAAIIIEPLLQGAAGMRIYPPLYLKKLREICDFYGVILIADEIATGFGRTGAMFACEKAGISPDIMVLSKGLTGGYMPMSVVATTQKIYDAFYAPYNEHKAFMHSHTYAGNPLGCAAALGVMKIFKEQNALKIANDTAKVLNELTLRAFSNHKFVGEVRSIGLINAIELVKDKDKKQSFDAKLRLGYEIYKVALKNGLLLRPLGDVLYFNPPLNITTDECEKAVEICKKSIEEVLK
ncbi:adenosylmethionine--8-amino-7-oxononanoate transaminase [Campylobacter mucosalis]|uniref:Adenosylmethionine-8-amino-7-oxononanoate aminotransferase n=1 Tax=Campylobacter mucosalis CCUG 21559 TaxID=1032067 RepID=A0A6G5QE95_9BACT|nr:adenosylmethionine--8-amino-7-oxononanoate transaminase [Campylobacter mucosalis]QCD43972.1 7,8-diaminopelargonic acid synthase [Campylobacter mucosalis CCUG 21559]